ncbi:MAG: hypothetical protein U5K79_03535 [Cyclobacteriaceae bacterium]|nr:hypothetical protein [Cyclobacteriaceae bacterium]
MSPRVLPISVFLGLWLSGSAISQKVSEKDTLFCGHKVVLDGQGKLLPWYTPHNKAYDHFLHLRWDFIKTKVPNAPGPEPRSNYPQYYFYASFDVKDGKIEAREWMNDVAEKIPNWFENARLYYAYTGDSSVMKIVRDFIDYALEHGTSPSDFAWPNFPYTTTNPGDIEFRGFSNHENLALHEIQVDHAGEMGLTYFRMYLFSGDEKYLTAALHVADVLAANARVGTAEKSVWPYRLIMDSGIITAEYGANWSGCYMLFDHLIKANLGNVTAYKDALMKTRDFLLQFPMKTGYWTDGHTDTDINSNTYKSNLSASNISLSMFDYPELNPNWKQDIPKLIKWTEDNFVFRCAPGEPATLWGANLVGEQDIYLPKMDYQTARYASQCARWYAISGDEAYKEKAFRCLNWVTYCNTDEGRAIESPVSSIDTWWSDCYGECPRMFYQAFAGVPEWAPSGENHILYSEGILKDVAYGNKKVLYTAVKTHDIEYLRLAFKPKIITLNGTALPLILKAEKEGYTLKSLENGDFAVKIHRNIGGRIVIEG